jgi:hypothetical protein
VFNPVKLLGQERFFGFCTVPEGVVVGELLKSLYKSAIFVQAMGIARTAMSDRW